MQSEGPNKHAWCMQWTTMKRRSVMKSVVCLGRGGWDGRWATWVYYYCGGDDKVGH
jgi:hypothetical protein